MKVKYPAYQCFKTIARNVYCSSKKYDSHPEAKPWIAACLKQYSLESNEILGKPYLSDDQPRNAIVYKMP